MMTSLALVNALYYRLTRSTETHTPHEYSAKSQRPEAATTPAPHGRRSRDTRVAAHMRVNELPERAGARRDARGRGRRGRT
jgi:hypothetical protein